MTLSIRRHMPRKKNGRPHASGRVRCQNRLFTIGFGFGPREYSCRARKQKGGARGESKRKEERARCNNPGTRALQPNLSTLRPDKITMWQDLTKHDLSGPRCDSLQRGTQGYIAVKAKNVAASPKHVAARPKYVRRTACDPACRGRVGPYRALPPR